MTRDTIFIAVIAAAIGCTGEGAGVERADSDGAVSLATAPLNETGVVARVTGEGGYFEGIPSWGSNAHLEYYEPGRDYVVRDGTQFLERAHGRISRVGCIDHGPECLSITGYRWPRTIEWTDRFEIELSNWSVDETAMRLGDTRYLRFYLRVDSRTDEIPVYPGYPAEDVVIMQAWQAHGGVGVAARRPAFAIALDATTPETPDTVRLLFLYSNDAMHGVPREGDEREATHRVFHTEVIDKDRWYNFHIEMRPQAAHEGSIRIWRDQGLSFAFSDRPPVHASTLVWGFTPTHPPGSACPRALDPPQPGVCDSFSVRLGLYRGQPTPTTGMPFVHFLMDSVKLTSTAEAMPGL
ncbi:hypothetical protein [Sandaracinus amylolyticus]|uniref:hypothetical protein n=1 Tax=Sandaracinus amylolyticus TaxID=927083 RepID=UPI001F37BF8C|nr:hypothetical protein [Sandaracinus amylolyticus]UJR86879.1 Hypothetical protein I5071_89800 [Sandaracinus amylolyticus]